MGYQKKKSFLCLRRGEGNDVPSVKKERLKQKPGPVEGWGNQVKEKKSSMSAVYETFISAEMRIPEE